jgi:hypothetical protein
VGDENEARSLVAALRFLAGWQETQEGEVIEGRPCQIFYDASRILPAWLPTGGDGGPLWAIAMRYRFPPCEAIFSKGATTRGRPGVLDFSIEMPEHVSELELWFEYSDDGGRHAVDSKFGRNYRFRVSRP